MGNVWDDKKKANEEMYFAEQNKRALERLKQRERGKKRLSPVTGEPMEEITYMGVVIDRCPKSGGIWLDAGELEEIIAAIQKEGKENQGSWLASFLEGVKGSK